MYLTPWKPKWGGVVSGNQFGDGASLGLFLTKEDGSAYDTDYSNIEYVSSNSGQVWTATPPVLLTGTKANVYAYYPYSSSVTNIEAIPIDVTQNKDVMWADYASNINNANPTATLPMNHALSVIRLSLSKGDYTGAGSIESIKIKGDCMAKTGTLNAKTGGVTASDEGAEIDLGATTTLTDAAQTVEQLVIPTTASGNISVTIQMDDKTFEATSSAPITSEQSKAYKFGLAFSDSKLTMSTVTIGTITEEDKGSMTPIVNNNPWSKFTTENDGVYGIKSDGSPMHYSEASTTSETLTGVAMVLNGKAYQISNVGSSSTYWWYSGYYNIDGLTDYDRVDASNSSGYLGGSSSPQLDKDYTVWSVGALSDFSGRNNTEKIIVAQDDGFTTHTIAYTIVDFRNGANNWNAQIFDDWYVPAAGQLAFLYLNKDKINTLLEKCGGRSLGDYRLWTSTEYNADYVWYVDFSYKGEVNYKKKNDMGYSNDYVRFIRDL